MKTGRPSLPGPRHDFGVVLSDEDNEHVLVVRDALPRRKGQGRTSKAAALRIIIQEHRELIWQLGKSSLQK